MTPESRQRIEDVYHSVVQKAPQQRDAFLAEACGGDEELRRQVQLLLDRPAWNASTATSLDSASLNPGMQLGPYLIESLLGAGGMGQVFRATDTRLHRTVAIKILPRDKISDPDRKRRFLQEARAVSALNHPHIVTLYDIASEGGVDYLVMEHVPGESLEKLLASRRLTLAEVIGYAAQLGAALAAAHAAGIVHRDIKPANIIVTAAGQAKVLDFGLAKLEERMPGPEDHTRTSAPTLTRPGMIMGTVAYMSPEQARGEEVDARTDLFSFGAVLYEMATGQRAFSKTFDWSAPAGGALPSELRRTVLKLLEADRDRRYQSAAEVVSELKELQKSRDHGSGHRRWRLLAATVAPLLLTVAGVLIFQTRRPPGRDQWLQLTRFPDSVSQPALSRDGRMLTFVRGPETFIGPGQVYVKMLPDGEPVPITSDKLNKMSPVFSPDGSRIAYTVNGWHTWVAPVLNGQPRVWLQNASGLVWLDQKRLLYSERRLAVPVQMGIMASEESRAGAREIYFPSSQRGMAHRSYPSPDGMSALVVEMEEGAWIPCRLVPLGSASQGRPVGPPGGRCTFAAWSPDGRWMYFSSSSADGPFHIWRQRYPDGQPEQITTGPTEEEGLAIFPDGKSFVSSVALRQSSVLLHDGSGDRQISVEGYSFDPKFTHDGKWLCYRILQGGLTTYDPSELRLVELDTGHNQPLLPGMSIAGQVGLAFDLSPDGRQVVAAANDAQGKPRLWMAALDRQSPPRQIPNVEGDAPIYGRDGEIFCRVKEGAHEFVYRLRADGTGLRRLSDIAIILPLGISQDGQWVIARATEDGGSGIVALPVQGGDPIRLFTASATFHLAWSQDGKLIYISVPSTATASHVVGKTFVIPLPPGRMFPPIPPGGFPHVSDLAELPGVRVIDAFDARPGPTPDIYAFSRATAQRNLYRIPIP